MNILWTPWGPHITYNGNHLHVEDINPSWTGASAPIKEEPYMPNEYRFYKPLNPLDKRSPSPCEGPCTCAPNPDYPVQPPQPGAALPEDESIVPECFSGVFTNEDYAHASANAAKGILDESDVKNWGGTMMLSIPKHQLKALVWGFTAQAEALAAKDAEIADRAASQVDLAHQLNTYEHERVAPLLARMKVLEEALHFYAEDDAKSVEAGIQVHVEDRPATAALRDVLQNSFDISYIKCIIQQDMQIAIEEYKRPSIMLRPALSVDGNQYCALYGSDLVCGVAGFGTTAEEAYRDFDKNWYRKPAGLEV